MGGVYIVRGYTHIARVYLPVRVYIGSLVRVYAYACGHVYVVLCLCIVYMLHVYVNGSNI